jgi:hypothetical protein
VLGLLDYPGLGVMSRGPLRGRRRAGASLFALAALLAFLLQPPVVQARLPRSFFGVNLGQPGTARDAEQMARGGVRSTRFQINWSVVQPSSGGPLNWAPSDVEFERFARTGVRTLPYLIGTPGWVAKSPYRAPVSSRTGRQGWRKFVVSAVDRYGPGGSFWAEHPDLPYLPVRTWQIWNEPNFPIYWHTRRPARDYVELLRISARRIRAVEAHARIVLAGLGPGLAKKSQTPCWVFLRSVYQLGGRSWFDVAADHPFAAGVHSMAHQLRRISSVMRRHHDGSPLWVDEIGWSSGHFAGNRLEVGVHRQAVLLRRSFRYIVGHAKGLHIKRLLWFEWRDPAASQSAGCRTCFDFGLRRHDGRAKPALHAYRSFVQRSGARTREPR